MKIKQHSAHPEILVGRACIATEIFFWLTVVIFAASLVLLKVTDDMLDNGNARLDAAQAHLDAVKLEVLTVCGRS